MPISNSEMTMTPNAHAGVETEVGARIAKDKAYLALEKVLATVDAAWNAGDASAFAALWIRHGTVVSLSGEVTEGRMGIERAMAQQLAGPLKGTTHTLNIERVYAVRPFVALIDGTAVIEARDKSQKWSAPFTAVLTRNISRTWQIAHLRSYVFHQQEVPV
jgi:uncharacterized protein (TIGR02246 family)